MIKRGFPMKNFSPLSLVLVVCCLAGISRADLVDYKTLNENPDTLQIYDDSSPYVTNQLFTLFNNYFELSGDAAYTSSNQLYADRGVKEIVTNWTANPGAQFVAGFKSAGYAHELTLADRVTGETLKDGDNPLFVKGYEAGENQTRLVDTVYDIPAVGEFAWKLSTSIGETFFSDPALNSDGLIHFVAFDVTDLMREKYGDMDIESAYMFGVEDIDTNAYWVDHDYQDLSFIAINVRPIPAATPEPATALILGLGLMTLPLIRQRRKNVVESA